MGLIFNVPESWQNNIIEKLYKNRVMRERWYEIKITRNMSDRSQVIIWRLGDKQKDIIGNIYGSSILYDNSWCLSYIILIKYFIDWSWHPIKYILCIIHMLFIQYLFATALNLCLRVTSPQFHSISLYYLICS